MRSLLGVREIRKLRYPASFVEGCCALPVEALRREGGVYGAGGRWAVLPVAGCCPKALGVGRGASCDRLGRT